MFTIKPIRLLLLAPLAVGALAACQPVHSQGPYDNDGYSDGLNPSNRVYRTADGRVFRTARERDAYLRRAEAQERAIYEEELRRQRQQSGSLSAQQRARRNARIEAERRRADAAEARARRAEQDAQRAERARRQAEREARGRRNDQAAQRERNRREQNERLAAQRERDRARNAERRAERANAEAERLRREDRAARRRAQRQGSLNAGGAAQDWRNYRQYRGANESIRDFEIRVSRAISNADREGGSVADWLAQSSSR